MELRFIGPQLRLLDTLGSELLACCVFSDQRPFRGLAGLVDWRLAARLSRYAEAGELSGELGDVTLVPGKPRLAFEKLLIFGLGPSAAFDEKVYGEVIDRMLMTLSELKVRMAVVERPGRLLASIDVVRSVDLLLERASNHQGQDAWTLVEEPHDQKRISAHLDEERHRKRLRR